MGTISSKRVNRLFLFWGPVMLITSVVLTPIKGTTPGFILSFLALPLVLTSFYRDKIAINIFNVLVFYLLYYFVAQIGNVLFDNDIPCGVPLISEGYSQLYFQPAHITQSLYLFPGFILFIILIYHYEAVYWKYINIGVAFLCLYGIYEWTFFVLTGHNGDFLTNRTFGDGGSGSLFQVINIAGFAVQRMKSLTGEPSMFAFVLMPFFVYYISVKNYRLSVLLFCCLILSTSTSAFLGFVIYFFQDLYLRIKNGLHGKIVITYGVLLVIFGLLIYAFFDIISAMYMLIEAKLTLKNQSGIDRFSIFNNALNYWLDLPFINQIFGIGFGTIRSTDMLATLLINTGVLGLCFFTFSIVVIIWKLNSEIPHEKGLKLGLSQILIISLISVPEFSYLQLWWFLGIACNILFTIGRDDEIKKYK